MFREEPVVKDLPKNIGTVAPKERLQALQDILKTESPPLCRGTLAVPAESFILYFGKETAARCALRISYAKKIDGILDRRIDLSHASEDDLAALTRECDAATFGRNQEDILDESYRKAGKLDNTAFATLFDPVRYGLVEVIRDSLLKGHEGTKPIHVELYKLNVYGETTATSICI